MQKDNKERLTENNDSYNASLRKEKTVDELLEMMKQSAKGTLDVVLFLIPMFFFVFLLKLDNVLICLYSRKMM